MSNAKKALQSLSFRRKPTKRLRQKEPKKHVSANLRISLRHLPEYSQT